METRRKQVMFRNAFTGELSTAYSKMQILDAIQKTMDEDFSEFNDHDKGVVSQVMVRLNMHLEMDGKGLGRAIDVISI